MGRTVSFPPNGQRILADPKYVVAFWRKYSQWPAKYALATGRHESDLTLNESDVEVSGFTSMGIFQISDEERADAGCPTADLMQLDDSCQVLALLTDKRVSAICTAVGLIENALPADVWFYCALAHNEGLGAALKTIRLHGLDAAAWIARNPQLAQAAKYFSDCMTGGLDWRPEFDAEEG